MNVLKIYCGTLFVSVLLLIPSLICGCAVSNIFSGIGCSGIAAALMAIFLEWENLQKNAKAKSLYFEPFYNHLIVTFERILWFYDRLNDPEFDWDCADDVYFSMDYMLAVNPKYQNRSLIYAEAVAELKSIGEKYDFQKVKSLPPKDKHKITRLFRLVAIGSKNLLVDANAVLKDKIYLENQGYLSAEDNAQMNFDISVSIGIMLKKDKSYKIAIDSLINIADQLRKKGTYNDCVTVGLHGQISINDL